MATPTRPCPYCGAAVLMNAPACGTCGRPMPPMQAGAPGGGQPAKTMFGYAAPVVPGQQRPGGAAPAQPQRPAQPQQPAQPAYSPPPQQGFEAPPQANPYGQQPQQPANPYGQQPGMQQPNPYAQPA